MRLIDADALMNTSYMLQGGTEEYHFGFDDGFRYFQREVVGDAPTIDAVPVVRCRDCRYNPKDGAFIGCPFEHRVFCFPDMYCGFGQRREEV